MNLKNMLAFVLLLTFNIASLASMSVQNTIGKADVIQTDVHNNLTAQNQKYLNEALYGLNCDFKNLDSEIKNSIMSFYTETEFPKDLSSELHSEVLLAIEGDYLDSEDLKDIFPGKCEVIIDQIATVVRDNVSVLLLDGPSDIIKACPQWYGLSQDDRKDFYVALVTSMALAESSCNNKVRNRGAPNGTAYGLWQSTKPMTPTQGALWVMEQLDSQVMQSGLLFWPNSRLNYWSVLNPRIHAKKVQKLLRKIPACVVKSMISN